MSTHYFSLLTELHLSHDTATAARTVYTAPLIFDRNAHQLPAIVRVADVFWTGIVLSGLASWWMVGPPFSIYTIPLQLIDCAGGWDTDCESVGEDIHTYLKCFFTLNGDVLLQTVMSPVSHTNVSGHGGYFDQIRARYQQGLRHMWSALDCGYVLRKTVEVWRRRGQSQNLTFRPLHLAQPFNDSDGAKNIKNQDQDQSMHNSKPSFNPADTVSTTIPLPKPAWSRIFWLWHRMFEIHFLHLQIIIPISTQVLLAVTEFNRSHHLWWIFSRCFLINTITLLELPLIILFYELYHFQVVEMRRKEMLRAGLADEMYFSYRGRKMVIDYLVGPLVALVFGALPAVQAQMMHFLTLNLEWRVSKKVVGMDKAKEKVESD